MKMLHVLIVRWVSPIVLTAATSCFSAESTSRIAPPTAATEARSKDHTPLHRAALRGDAEAVESLLAAGADANARNQFGATPLHYGIGSERVVVALLAHGARTEIVSDAGVTPLLGAVSRNDSIGVVRRLVEAGADVNLTRPDRGERTRGERVLSLAIAGGDRRTIELLLDPKTKLDPAQYGPGLVAAALAGDAETTRILIERGADLNTSVGSTGTALNTALRGGHNEIAKLLIAAGADLNQKSTRGYGTAPILFTAYSDGCDASVARLLVERGADINTTNELGETALTHALKSGDDTDLVRFLRERGATSPAPARAKPFPVRDVPTDITARTDMVRDAAQRAIDLMQRSSNAFLESGFVRNQSKCISCHHQSLPAVAYGLARERGLRVNESDLGHQLVAKEAIRTSQIGRALELIIPTGGATISLGFDAEELTALRAAPNETTDAMSHYLLGVQAADGSWSAPIRRLPMSDGSITGTAWSLRAVSLFPPAGRERDADEAVLRARAWLSSQKPPTANERIFQLLGLAWAKEPPARLVPFRDAIAREQRPDGSWGQLPGIPGDAWATGSALHALHLSGVATSDPVYQRGIDFLLRTQFDDGSWWVRSRAWPFQPHFDTNFPHGRDQWISAGATAYAAAALLHTIEPRVPIAQVSNAKQLIAGFLATSPAQPTGTSTRAIPAHGPLRATPGNIEFARDIQPLFERSCAECHGGAKPKGGFSLASRESLLKGGLNAEPVVVPGHAKDSHVLRYVSGQVEDLEMPPLNKREKFPALTQVEIEQLRRWIDEGAVWPSRETSDQN
jgi:ankyrin repeat protein